MTDKLPSNAFVGGHENQPLCIARANHNGDIVPGKYIHSNENLTSQIRATV